MSRIFQDLEHQFELLSCMLGQLTDHEYKKRGEHIGSIGTHVRHVLEYVQILIQADLQQPIDYSKRKRDQKIENNRNHALDVIEKLKSGVYKEDRLVSIQEDEETLSSSYLREVLYMHEHIVHHCAILRVELETLKDYQVDPCFGFAKSTLKHLESNVSA